MLSKIFGKPISLDIDELKDFLEANSDKRLSNINKKIHDIKEKNERIIENVKYILETISHYNISKETLEDAEYRLISSSISTIHEETRNLMNIVDEELDHLKLKKQAEEFQERYEHFKMDIKNHLKKIEPYFKDMITPFLQKMKDLNQNIMHIDETLTDDLIKEYYSMLSEVKKLDRISPDKETQKTIKDIKSKILKLSVRISALQDKKETMMLTDQFKMSKKTYKDNNELRESIKDIRDEISFLFDSIIPLLSLYNKKFYSRILNNYIESPSQGLLNDKNLDIVENLKKIQGKIQEEKIKITKNKQEIIASIKAITKTKLKSLKQKLEKLEEQHQRKRVLLTKNKIMLDIIELDYQMDHLKEKMNRYESQLKGNEPMDYTELKELLEGLTRRIKSFTGKKIKVTYDA